MNAMPPFKLEEFWKKYEFTAPYLLCCSDAESWAMHEIVEFADNETKSLWQSLRLGYTESSGLPLLRSEIARLYQSISAEHVLTTAGAEEGIYATMRALLELGDHVIIIDPCYQSLSTIAERIGVDITRIKLEPNKQWQLDLDELKRAFRSNTKMLILNYPHNPTGTILTPESYKELIQMARHCGAYIFNDEVYRYMEIDETKRLASIADAYEKGIALNVMTKSFGLAGLRIGWLASQDVQALQKIGSYKLYLSICNSAPSEILALIALRAKEKLLQKSRTIMLDNLRYLSSFMQRQQHILSWIPPQSGTVALINLLLPISASQFSEQVVQKSGVLIMPGTVFDLPDTYFRIGFARQNMPSILDRFEEFLHSFRC